MSEKFSQNIEAQKADIERRRQEELSVYDLRSSAFEKLANRTFRSQIIALAEAKSILDLYDFVVKNRTHEFNPTAVDRAVKVKQATMVAVDAQKAGIGTAVDVNTLRCHIKIINATLLHRDEVNAKYDAELAAISGDTASDIISKF